MRDEQLLKAIETIYDAALEPERWHDTIRAVADFVGAERGMVGLTDTRSGHADISYRYRMDPELMDRWAREFNAEDPWADGMTAVSEGEVGRGSDLMPYAALERRPVFREICVPVGAYDTCWTALAANRLRIGWLSVFQGEDQGPFPQACVERMAVLAPHLMRAARIHAHFAELRERTEAIEGALDRLSFGVLTCTADARIVTVNRRAAELFRSGGCLRLVRHRLCAPTPGETERLRGLIAAAAATALGRAANGGGVVALRRIDPSLPPLGATIAPISPRVASRVAQPPTSSSALALVLVTNPEQPLDVPEGALAQIFGLTPAEASLTLALARGDSLTDHASRANITENTARWTLKRVLAKTNTGRQSALVSLVLRSLEPLASDADPTARVE